MSILPKTPNQERLLDRATQEGVYLLEIMDLPQVISANDLLAHLYRKKLKNQLLRLFQWSLHTETEESLIIKLLALQRIWQSLMNEDVLWK